MMPKVIGSDSLIARVNEVQGCMYRQSNELGRLNRAVKRYKEENAKLREELAKARDPQRIGGQADPSSFVYAIEQLREFRWQHATNDEDAIPYINNVAAAHERENAKLRELVREAIYARDDADWASIVSTAIGLGVEADG